jgi:hypothetical protein
MAGESIVIDGLVEVMQKLEAIPAKVARDVRDHHLDKAARVIRAEIKSSAPVGNEADRRKQSDRHRDKWAGTKKAKDSVEYVIRKYADLAFSAFIGPEYPHGSKWYFDYYGPSRFRHMFFWRPGATSRGSTPSQPDRIRRKRDIIKEVKDRTQARIIADLERGIADAVARHMEDLSG